MSNNMYEGLPQGQEIRDEFKRALFKFFMDTKHLKGDKFDMEKERKLISMYVHSIPEDL